MPGFRGLFVVFLLLLFAVPASASTMLPDGYLSTKGSQIIDHTGRPVRINAVGWNQIGPDIADNVAGMRRAGFNAVRVSWVNESVQRDLAVIDRIVEAAARHGIKVIIDNHTNNVGRGPRDNWGAQQKNGLWYDKGGASDGTDGGGNVGTTTDAKFLDDWVIVARRYAGNTTVIGYDLRNEPLAYRGMSTWGDDSNRDLRAMYQRVGNAVQAVDPGKLIICEGPQNFRGSFAGTGPAPWGDLSLVARFPVVLNVPNKLVYSVHDYPAYVTGFRPDSGPEKVRMMNAAWGYIVTRGIAPVWIGELGANLTDPSQHAWAQTMIAYVNGRLGDLGGPTFKEDEEGIGTCWWVWGHLPGQELEGTLTANGSLRAAQRAVWMQLRGK
jgi:aryl-phospho-beta-D-glucosidase BglC (GH1 family)